jgi:hypothetical protein
MSTKRASGRTAIPFCDETHVSRAKQGSAGAGPGLRPFAAEKSLAVQVPGVSLAGGDLLVELGRIGLLVT